MRRAIPDKISADEWNERHPIGTRVRYHPILTDAQYIETKTRSEAWELGHGEAVVKVEGRSGGVAVMSLDVAESDP